MEKRTPHYKLSQVKAVVADPQSRPFTVTALRGGLALGLSEPEMRLVVMALKGSDFYKSMTTYADHREWQDVYHGETRDGIAVYIKITCYDDDRPPVIQFKQKRGVTMKCPACGHAEMTAQTKDELLSYGSHSLTLHALRGEFCPGCGEGIWDPESYRRYTEAQAALVRAAKGDVIADIRRIRKNLKLTQTELAEAFGVGKVAFSRYERGETRPPAPLVKLLKLIERHPELLAEVRGENGCRNGLDEVV